LFDDFHRSIDPSSDVAGLNDAGRPKLDPNYARDQLGIGTRLQLSDAGRRCFRAGLGYRADFDSLRGQRLPGRSQPQSHGDGDTSWEFCRRRRCFWNGSVRLLDFTNDTPASADRNTASMSPRAPASTVL